MDRHTRKSKRLTQEDNICRPNWSPDGKHIAFQIDAFARDQSQYFSIWRMDSDGSHLQKLTNTDTNSHVDDQTPRWSRDGAQIVWTHGNQIWIMNADGTDCRPLTVRRAGRYEYPCDVSPDGKQLVYVATDDVSPDYHIRFLSIADQKQTNFSNEVIALGVRWSADGRYLYYNTGTDVMKIMADASEKAKSVYRFQEGLEIHGFDISQDNKYIVYDDSGAEREGTIYVGILH
jgi:Tol biopolymer transport system component